MKKVWQTDGQTDGETDRQTDRKYHSLSCLVAAKNSIWLPSDHFENDIAANGWASTHIQKSQNLIWLPGGHFESGITESHQASAHGHQWHARGIWNWNSKANSCCAPENLPPTESRKKSNMAARQPFGKWYHWKLIGFYPYTNQAAILTVMSLKINRLLPMALCTWNLKLKFQSKLEALVTMSSTNGWMDRWSGGWTDMVNPVYHPPSTSFSRVINIKIFNDPV